MCNSSVTFENASRRLRQGECICSKASLSMGKAETFMPHFSDAQISTIFVARYNNDNCKRQAFYFRYNPS